MPKHLLQDELKKAIEEMGYSELTDIQVKSIPLILQGKDLIGQSFTGSGKTAAFGLPILHNTSHGHGIQSLILVPTRELCEQVTKELRKFSKHKRMHISAVYGGVSINPQMMNLRHADIVVGTPGRILDHLQRGTLNLSKVKFLVLDEADKMFEMGFIDDVKQIVSQTPRNRQTLLFSATISTQIMDIVRHYMNHPERIKVQEYVDKSKLEQQFIQVPSRDKFSLLVHILGEFRHGLAIIFCATRNRVDALSRNLHKQGVINEKLHGGISQNKRNRAIELFHARKVNVLIASDVAARGLDIKNVTLVMNYDIPKTSKEYIHRIGRTARAGEEGKVISLLSEEDHDNMRAILDDRSIQIQEQKTPEFKRVPFQARDYGERRDFAPRRGFGQRRYGHSSQRSRGHGERGHIEKSSEERTHSSYSHGHSRPGQQRGYRPRHRRNFR